MEDDRRLVGVLEEDLLGDIDKDGQDQEGEHGDTNLRAGAELLKVVDGLGRHLVDETHGNVGGDCLSRRGTKREWMRQRQKRERESQGPRTRARAVS